MSKYQDLIVWQKAMYLVEAVYSVVRDLPSYENFALSDQLRRAAVSIPSNIAEGQRRGSNKEIIQFGSIALGSLAEVQTQLVLVERLHGIDTSVVLEQAGEIERMLIALIKSLRS